MADLRRLNRTRIRFAWRPLSDTGGSATLEYALLIFVISVMAGFVLPTFGISIVTLFDQLSAAIDAVVASLND